jgi:ESCRT-I complex subunit TSG101
MAIWIVEMYPYHPPICYVTPGINMMIKPKHKFVDSSGRCYSKYLNEWNAKTSNLYELINELSIIFGADPPVYEKPNYEQEQLQALQLQQQQQQQTQSSNNLRSTTTTSNNNNQLQQQTTKQQTNVSSNNMRQTVSSTGSGHLSTNSTSSTGSTGGLLGSLFNTIKPDYQGQLNRKISGKLEGYNREISEAIDKEFQTQGKLAERQRQLEGVFQQVGSDKEQLEKGLTIIRSNDAKLTQWLEANENVDVEKELAGSLLDELGKQVLELQAGDHATEDAFYHLDKQIQKQGIDLDTYLATIREVAKQQFINKALLKKIHKF